MPPQIPDIQTWQQAELLMQPTLLRVIDNIRKQLDQSSWRGRYEEIESPNMIYRLCLEKDDRSYRFDLWELCYQVCFHNYQPNQLTAQVAVIDSDLIDAVGEVDWQKLDDKALRVIGQIFTDLEREENQTAE